MKLCSYLVSFSYEGSVSVLLDQPIFLRFSFNRREFFLHKLFMSLLDVLYYNA